MSLRTRLALFIALIVALAVIAQGAVGYARYERLSLEEADGVLLGVLDTIARSLTDEFAPPQRGESPPLSSQSLSPTSTPGLDGVRARLVENGVVLRTFGEAFPDVVVPRRGVATAAAWRVVAVPLDRLAPGRRGAPGAGLRLEGALSLDNQQRGVANYLRSLVLTVPLFAALGAFAAFIFSAPALAPLAMLVRTAERVAESGDLSQRVPGMRSKRGIGGELDRLAYVFNRMLERLQGFREREVSFTRTAAHELRTPLAAMRAQLDAESLGWATPEEVLRAARTQVDRMTRLSEALLVLAREGRAELVSIDLAALVREVAERHAVIYRGPVHSIVEGNAVLLEGALENLLDNAAKHAPGTRVIVELAGVGSLLELSVTDEGKGLADEALDRAGEAFYRAPGTRAGGSGLGLATTRRVAEVHGGSLKLENVSPHGLRVSLLLPTSLSQPRAG